MTSGRIVAPPSMSAGVLLLFFGTIHDVSLLFCSPAVLPDLLREGLLHLLIGNLAQGGRGEKDNCTFIVFSSTTGRGLHQQIQ